MRFTVGLLLLASAHAFIGPSALSPSRLNPSALKQTSGLSAPPPLRTAPLRARTGLGLRMATAEKFEFQAEVTRVMDIIINSLYSDKDVFLRELVSNAADACDKKRFLALTENKGAADDLGIKIKTDKEEKLVIIEDSGVGMTKEEIINNLGRIAQSGTKAFSEMLKAKEQPEVDGEEVNLIGQFGVGFYSGFLVADKITVITKGLGDDDGKTHKWESDASGYTIEEVSGDEEISGASGTRLILRLREDAEEYLDPFKVKTLVSRYSEFVSFPISIWSEKTTYEQVDDEEANTDLADGEEPKKKTVPVTTQDWELQNTQKPLWMRTPSEVTKEQYEEFYKGTFKAYDTPVTLSHFSLEGQVEFKALLFIPGELPYELNANMFEGSAGSLRLYVKRVFINDKFTELCPRWLMFLKGVIDSEDLPLNVGREILQKSSVLRVVSRRVVKKSLDMFEDLKEKGGEDWMTFQKNFGKYLKVGVIEDSENREDIGDYIMFPSNNAGNGSMTTLDQYVDRMKEGQTHIYFVSGDGRSQCEMLPALDKVRENGYEVIFCTETLDELSLLELKTYDGKEIVDLRSDEVPGIDDKDDTKEQKEAKQKEFAKVLQYLKTTIGEEIISRAEVSLSLKDSPAVLAQGQFGMSPQMQKYMKSRSVALGEENNPLQGIAMPSIFQVNPEHEAILKLKKTLDDGEPNDETERTARLLYNVAALRGGYDIVNPGQFASLVTELLV